MASSSCRCRPRARPFGGLVAVNDVGFDVRAGEIVGLIGPNGAGKSTLFNLITGVLPLTSGRVDFRGRRVDGKTSRAIAALGMSRTFQHVRMIPDMSVLENVALGAHRRGQAGVPRAMLRLDRGDERRLLAEAWRQLDRIGMTSLANEPAGNLALGQQRLMEIARALCTDPALMLLDEPAAGLRLKEKEALAGALAQLRAEGMSLLLVEHDMDFVMTLTDRIVVVEFGTLLVEGTPEAVRETPPCGRPTSAWSTDGHGRDGIPAAGGRRPARGLRPGRGADRHPDRRGAGKRRRGRRPERRGQEHAPERADGRAARARKHPLRRRGGRRLSLEERVLRGIALVPETRALFASMPVGDNLLLGGYRQRRTARSLQAARLDEVYALFPRLRERRAQDAGTLSGGERQMLAIGRALMARRAC
jgi:ABC-type branched-subunit amino acid transport system ATPase component